MACEFVKENYELDMNLKVIVFPSYLYPPITNTVMGVYKKQSKLLDIFNLRDWEKSCLRLIQIKIYPTLLISKSKFIITII